MGASASTTIEKEKALPLDGSDINTPRGETAKQEVIRLRKLLQEYNESDITSAVPDLTHYLSQMFQKADVDGSGELSADEFWQLIREDLNLGLSDDQIQQLQDSGDVDTDGNVSWAEFVAMSPKLISNLMANTQASKLDWAEFSNDEGQVYYYNKRTGESVWEKPMEMIDQEAQESYENMAPGLQIFLERWFTEADTDKTGVLSKENFHKLLKDTLKLNLTDEKIEAIQSSYDFDHDDSISWSEFVSSIPELLIRSCEDTDPSITDWCSLLTEDGKTYYYNYRTQISQYEKPEGFADE